MSAGEIAVLIAAGACVLVTGGLLFAITTLRRQVADLAAVVDELRRQTVPLVADAHRVVDQAATEMQRIDAVLESTESVHATVDSASRLAYRAFANPVVKVLAIRAGAAGGVRQLRARPTATTRSRTRGTTPTAGSGSGSGSRGRGR
jgi:hypothetical protein